MGFDNDSEEEDVDDEPTAEDLAFIDDDGSESGGEGPSFYRNVDLARVVSDQYLYLSVNEKKKYVAHNAFFLFSEREQ